MDKERTAVGDPALDIEPPHEAQQFVNRALFNLGLFPPTHYASGTADYFMHLIADRLDDSVLLDFNGQLIGKGGIMVTPTSLPSADMKVTFAPKDTDGTEYINLSKVSEVLQLSGGIPVSSDTYQVQYSYLAEDAENNVHDVCFEMQVNVEDNDKNWITFFDETFIGASRSAVIKNLWLYSREERLKNEYNPSEYSYAQWVAQYGYTFAKEEGHLNPDDWETMTNEDVIKGVKIPLPQWVK